ncbi:MAG TPA: hypothetical protein DIW31_02605 [Bacteroidales bacterium]|nr:hypothetical protein [Bacteroidales bacterium]
MFYFFLQNFSGIGQKPFVFFETTKKSNEVCQGKTIGVIATINSQIENYISFKWSGESKDVNEIRNEIVTVNSSEPGEKKLKFTLMVKENIKYDTVYIVKVLPKPDVSLDVSSKEIRVISKDILTLSGFKWKYNGVLLVEETDSVFKNPKRGSYQVFVLDNKGCRNSSQIIKVE